MDRFPHFAPVEHGGRRPNGVSPSEHFRVVGLAEEVRRRTGASTWYDLARGSIVFGYRRRGGRRALAFSVPMFKRSNRSCVTANKCDPTTGDLLGVEEIVYALSLGRVNPKLKDRWAATVRERAAHEMARKHDRDFEARLPDAMARTRRMAERYAMGRHYKGRAVVNGLKGAMQ